jgi:hypothetical protein
MNPQRCAFSRTIKTLSRKDFGPTAAPTTGPACRLRFRCNSASPFRRQGTSATCSSRTARFEMTLATAACYFVAAHRARLSVSD